MENFKEIFDKVLIETLTITKEQITPEARFKEDLGADSLDMAELVVHFESEFNISIPDEAIDKIEVVADAGFYILNLLETKNSSQ